MSMVKGLFRSRFGVIIIGIALIFILFLFEGLPGSGIPGLTWQRPGWEVSAENVGLGLNEGGAATYYKSRGSIITHDFDAYDIGYPDIQSSLSDIREEISPKTATPQITEDLTSYKYVAQYHEYLFDIQVRTIANSKNFGDNGNGQEWHHETALPYSWRSNILGSGSYNTGKEFVGQVFARFAVHPWGIPETDQVANYTFSRYWFGIMNAKALKAIAGKVTDNPESDNAHGFARNVLGDSQLNMYSDDGSLAVPYESIPWDTSKVLSNDIASSVIVEIPVDLMAGAFENYDPWYYAGFGSISKVTPVDFYVQYTIRMECFIVKEYKANDPVIPIDPTRLTPPKDFVPVSLDSLWNQYWMYIVAAIVIFIVVIVVAGPSMGALFGVLLSSVKVYSNGDNVKWL